MKQTPSNLFLILLVSLLNLVGFIYLPHMIRYLNLFASLYLMATFLENYLDPEDEDYHYE